MEGIPSLRALATFRRAVQSASGASEVAGESAQRGSTETLPAPRWPRRGEATRGERAIASRRQWTCPTWRRAPATRGLRRAILKSTCLRLESSSAFFFSRRRSNTRADEAIEAARFIWSARIG